MKKVSKVYTSQCTGKYRHKDRLGAAMHAASLNNSSKVGSTKVHVYHCKICGGWHVGHRSK